MRISCAIPLCLILILANGIAPLTALGQDASSVTLTFAGGKLTAEEAGDLENILAGNPNDLSSRTKLLGYYFLKQATSAEVRKAFRTHVLWMIRNYPEAEITGTPYCQLQALLDQEGYTLGKQLWLAHIETHPQNTLFLDHAAQFFLLNDRSLAEDLLKRAQTIEPGNPRWSERLANLYRLQGAAGVANSFVEFERAQNADSSEMTRFYRLASLAKSAFDAGELGKASQYANDLLQEAPKHPRDWNYGNAIHHGNNVLGRIALKQGFVDQAKQYLLKAGQTPGSPQLDSFGPNMSLAKDLLEKGERDVVLQYFDLCRSFWKMGGKSLDGWIEDVKAGKTPVFGANLSY